MRFLVSAEGSASSRLSMVCASMIEIELSSAVYAQLFVDRLRQAMAVLSRVLNCFGLLRKFSRCDWSVWLLIVHEFEMRYDVVNYVLFVVCVIRLWWGGRISTEIIRKCQVFTGNMAYVN